MRRFLLAIEAFKRLLLAYDKLYLLGESGDR
jgi:hypothetical protein